MIQNDLITNQSLEMGEMLNKSWVVAKQMIGKKQIDDHPGQILVF